MARICEICGKGYLKGKQVPRGVGRRVTRRTSIRQQPNLRSRKFEIDGRTVTVRICSSCLKRMKMDAAEDEVTAEAEATVQAKV